MKAWNIILRLLLCGNRKKPTETSMFIIDPSAVTLLLKDAGEEKQKKVDD